MWVNGMPGSDLTKNRMLGIAYSLEHGHLTAKQATELRNDLQDPPTRGRGLADKLVKFDNVYEHGRSDALGALSVTFGAEKGGRARSWMSLRGVQSLDGERGQARLRRPASATER